MRLLKTLALAAAIIATSISGAASAQSTADLSVSVVGSPDPVARNDPVTWTISVRNLGPGQATGVRLQASYGSDSSPVSATTTQGTCSHTTGGIVDFSMGTISPGGVVTATAVMQSFGGDGDALRVTASSTTNDPNMKNNSAVGRVDIFGESPFRELSGTFCPPSGGVATGGGGTAADSQAWLATFGLLTLAGLAVAAVKRVRR
jgi:uncharacterized repeat protein (TIGR01451 family)